MGIMAEARNYRLTSPGGTTFYAKISFEPGLVMYSTRADGTWAEDPTLNVADIVMQGNGKYYDWEIERLPDD